jgi:hypothetical protein
MLQKVTMLIAVVLTRIIINYEIVFRAIQGTMYYSTCSAGSHSIQFTGLFCLSLEISNSLSRIAVVSYLLNAIFSELIVDGCNHSGPNKWYPLRFLENLILSNKMNRNPQKIAKMTKICLWNVKTA